MPERSVTHNTFTIERTYPVPAEQVFAALADPSKKRRWYAEESENHEVEAFEMDFRVGGKECAQYRFKSGTLFPGAILSHEGIYQDIVQDRRVVIASTMALGGRRFSASLATFELVPAGKATELVLTHQGAFFEGADGSERRRDGWRKLLDRMADQLEG